MDATRFWMPCRRIEDSHLASSLLISPSCPKGCWRYFRSYEQQTHATRLAQACRLLPNCQQAIARGIIYNQASQQGQTLRVRAPRAGLVS